MTIKIQEPFKFLKYLEGAEKWHKSFEKMCSEILHVKHSDDTVIRIDGSGGDDGIDVLVKGSDTKMTIYQFYTDTFHKEKISSSFLTAYKKNKNDNFKQWVLVIPKTLTNSERLWWDEFKQEHKEKGIEFKIWDEDKIVYLLKKNLLYDSYYLNENELKVRRRSEDLIAEWNEERKIFEETSISLKAYDVLKQNNILILNGQSQSGKTSIARNICCSTIEEDEQLIMVPLTLNGFKDYYDSYKLKRIYLFDNVFGERAVEEKRFSELDEEMFSYLNKAIRAGSKVIITSRDYIFKEVLNSEILTSYLDKFPHLFDDQNIVDVDIKSYSPMEKKNILLKHVNASSMEEQKKLILKTHSNKIIHLDEFTPELIRRLVDDRLNKNIEFSWSGIESYFKNPISYLKDLFNNFDEDKKTALLLMLLNEGQVPTHINDKFLEGKIELIQKNIDSSRLIDALTNIPSSLIKREVVGNQKVWKFHHPSIEEALIEKLVNNIKVNDRQIELFLNVADFRTLIDNITVDPSNGNRIYITKELWGSMSKRLFGTIGNTKANYDYFKDSYVIRKEDLTRFFAEQTNNDFLEWFNDEFSDSPEVWKQLVSKSIFNQLHSIGSYKIAYRLEKLGFLPLEVKNEVTENIKEVARRTFDVTFLEDSNMRKFIGEEVANELLEYYKSEGIGLAEEEMNSFFDNIDLNEYLIEDIDSQFDLWCSSVKLLKDKLSETDLLTYDLDIEFENLISQVEQRKEQIIEDHEIESEEDDSLHKELLEEFVGKAFRITQKNDLIKLVKDCIDKMVTNLNYNHEDAIIYIGEVLNSEGIQEFEVIKNLQDALHQYIENNAYSIPDSTF
ncbi:hypothetical protein [Paenibacillus polymyxa]|uniref:nSTAND3 domain-containing NTPase n=1 Tax=Paenibacillus polymyxa TaxID=1406 RepID=UPI0023798210|nr:hypothetical protein [Paenibacillus polymyxa]WDM21259.1 hypothetical protein J4I02_20175 [Paenibacillus polymyxa]